MVSNSQLQKLGDRLRKGTPTEADLQMLDEHRASFSGPLGHVVGLVRTLGYEPSHRQKTQESIVQKLEREKTNLSRMRDIAGCRFTVDGFNIDGVTAQDRAVLAIKQILTIVDFEDRRLKPNHGYRAVHLIAEHESRKVEIQIRTKLQDFWARLSEGLSAAFPDIKYGGGPDATRQHLLELSGLCAKLETMQLPISKEEINAIDRSVRMTFDSLFATLTPSGLSSPKEDETKRDA